MQGREGKERGNEMSITYVAASSEEMAVWLVILMKLKGVVGV